MAPVHISIKLADSPFKLAFLITHLFILFLIFDILIVLFIIDRQILIESSPILRIFEIQVLSIFIFNSFINRDLCFVHIFIQIHMSKCVIDIQIVFKQFSFLELILSFFVDIFFAGQTDDTELSQHIFLILPVQHILA